MSDDIVCSVCGEGDAWESNEILLCDGCDNPYHQLCLKPALKVVPSGEWHCPSCCRKAARRSRGKGKCKSSPPKADNDDAYEPSDVENEEDSDDSASLFEPHTSKSRRVAKRAPSIVAAKRAPSNTGESSTAALSPGNDRCVAIRPVPACHTGNYCVEYAKSGRAKCQVCGKLIEKEALRVGIEQAEKGWGEIWRWQHLACCRLPSAVCSVEYLEGFDAIEDKDRPLVLEMLSSLDPPSHLKAIDPDAEIESAAKAWSTQREPPPELDAQMLPYQKEGLGWMCAQEESTVRGGILADEMGMGKTLQTIALMLAHKETPPVCHECEGLPNGGTLIVLPVIALVQWKSEILRWAKPGALTVHTYYGANRKALPEQLAQHDVVLTSYQTLEYDYRIAQAHKYVSCPYCAKKFKNEQKLAVHNRFHCGPNAQRSAAQSKTQKRAVRSGEGGLAKLMGLQADEREDEDDEDDDDDDYVDDDDSPKGKKRSPMPTPIAVEAASSGASSSKTSRKSSPSVTGRQKKKQKSDTKSDAKSDAKSGKGKGEGKAKGKAKANGKGKAKMAVESDSVDSSAEEGGEGSDDDMAQGSNDGGSYLSRRAAKAAERAENAARAASRSVLHRVNWRRVVLDEAHAIKDRRSSTAQATFALNAVFRWCLSGTPLQNRVGELYSLVQFCRLDPYCYYFCKAKDKSCEGGVCNCKCREYSFDAEYRYCNHCGHTPLQHYSLFNQAIVNPIRKFGYIGAGAEGFVTLKRDVLSKLLLRRTKASRADEMVLPPKLVTLEANFLDDKENDFYQAIYTQSQAQFSGYVEAGTLLNNYAHIFDLLTRLRQAVDHPYLVIYNPKRELDEATSATVLGDGDDTNASRVPVVCGLCFDTAQDPITSACEHSFCRECVQEFLLREHDEAPGCPTCSKPLSIDLQGSFVPRNAHARKSILSKLSSLEDFQTSTKMEALMEELSRMVKADPSAKAIVFSQFVSFLDLLEHRIQRGGIKVVKLNGSVSLGARDAVLTAFKEDPDVRVIVISLKAGGVALNLTVASHIYLMDPWWNPAAEYQAIDRAHRLGQHKPIRAVRFVVRNTVEERIIRLQDKKRLVFESTIGGDAGSLAQLTEEDLRFLFQN